MSEREEWSSGAVEAAQVHFGVASTSGEMSVRRGAVRCDAVWVEPAGLRRALVSIDRVLGITCRITLIRDDEAARGEARKKGAVRCCTQPKMRFARKTSVNRRSACANQIEPSSQALA